MMNSHFFKKFPACECNEEGSLNNDCDHIDGQCACKDDNITGRKCDQTPPGYYDFPDPKRKLQKIKILFQNLTVFDNFLHWLF